MNGISIITLATPENAGVGATLDAIGETVRDIPFQSLIADNAAGISAEIPDNRSFGSTLIASSDRMSTAALLNAVVEHAQGDIVVFLPAGARPEPYWLAGILTTMTGDEVGAVIPRLVDASGQTIRACGVSVTAGKFSSALGGLPRDAFGALRPQLIDMAWLDGLAVRRSVFSQSGRFDVELGDALGDIDFCLRIRTHKQRLVYRPDVTIRYDGPIAAERPRTLADAARFTERWNRFFTPPLLPEDLAL